jgi:hypothetical protein
MRSGGYCDATNAGCENTLSIYLYSDSSSGGMMVFLNCKSFSSFDNESSSSCASVCTAVEGVVLVCCVLEYSAVSALPLCTHQC